MDGGGRNKFDNFRDERLPWNMVNQHQMREQNALILNKRLLNIIAERDAAIEERNRALLEKKTALEERETAISQRNMAIRERNDAIVERDHALSALQQCMTYHPELQRGTHNLLSEETTTQVLNDKSPHQLNPRKEKWAGKVNLNRKAKPKPKPKPKAVGPDSGLNRVDFDESTMPAPGCSCTGVFRQCYKWGNGGWQSSCCTTTMSAYPLPQVPNKRYARMGGRKMSGSAFSKLLSRLALEGYEFSVPVDLKFHWSKHGTNRYITIK